MLEQISSEIMFHEPLISKLKRVTLGAAWALRPDRAVGLPTLGYHLAREIVSPSKQLPDPQLALHQPRGFCGIARDLSPERLAAAYRRGMYPFAHIAPLKWWSPPERCILSFRDFHISKRLRSRLRQSRHHVTFDRSFAEVMKACAEPREGKWQLTWITPTIMRAYQELHNAGYAHSFEVWNENNDLIGGGYGVAVGGSFAIESQFTREAHSSKIGFAVLNWHLARWGFVMNDNKLPTRNTLEMGFRVVPRADYLDRLKDAALLPDRGRSWSVETDLANVAAWLPNASSVPSTEAIANR